MHVFCVAPEGHILIPLFSEATFDPSWNHVSGVGIRFSSPVSSSHQSVGETGVNEKLVGVAANNLLNQLVAAIDEPSMFEYTLEEKELSHRSLVHQGQFGFEKKKTVEEVKKKR